MKRLNRKNLILSVVALVLVLMLSVGATYSWIEDLKLVELNTNDDAGTAIPLTVGNKIDGVYNVTSANAYMNLGPVWKTNSKGNKQIDTDAKTVNGYSVNGNKGYFYESGGVHLTPCYGDGQDFYFSNTQGSNKYSIGNHDNFNVDLISSTIQVNSPTAKTEFWFENVAFTLKDSNGATITNGDQYIRVAIIADGITKVYSKGGNYKTINSYWENPTGTFTPGSTSCSTFDAYTYGNAANSSPIRDTNGNTLFAISKGGSKNITIRIWLEKNNAISGAVTADLQMRLVSSWAFTRNITIEDKTTDDKNVSWLVGENSNDKVYLAIPAAKVNNQWQEGVSYWQVGVTSSVHTATVQNIPAVYNDEKMYLYRCNNQFDNIGTNTGFDAYNYDGGVHAWNFWETNLPDSFVDRTFSLYGGSRDNIMHSIFGITQTNEGYGTWDGVSTVEFHSTDITVKDSNTKLAAPAKDLSNPKLMIEDYSDYFTSGHIYYSIMYCYDTDNGKWRIYLPSTSTKITFHYKADSKTDSGDGYYGHERYFGYRVQTDATNVYKTYETLNMDNGHFGAYERTSSQNIFTTNNKDQHYDWWRFSGVWSSGTTDEQATQATSATQASSSSSSGQTLSMSGYTNYSGTCYDLHYTPSGGSETTSRFYTNTSVQDSHYRAVIPLTTSNTEFLIRRTTDNKDFRLSGDASSRTKTVPLDTELIVYVSDNNPGNVIIKTASAADNGDYVIDFYVDGSNLKIENILKKDT